jgi:hypothetical protein
MKTLLGPAMLGIVLALSNVEEAMSDPPHPYIGMWVTADGYVRHELLPNGRYDEARGDRESAY